MERAPILDPVIGQRYLVTFPSLYPEKGKLVKPILR